MRVIRTEWQCHRPCQPQHKAARRWTRGSPPHPVQAGGTPVSKLGVPGHREVGSERCPAPPPSHPGPQPCPPGPGGSAGSGLPEPPPEVRQHFRVPGTRTGRAAIWPGPFPVGFPLPTAWGRGQGQSCPHRHARPVPRGEATATQVAQARTPSLSRLQLGVPRAGLPPARPAQGWRSGPATPQAGWGPQCRAAGGGYAPDTQGPARNASGTASAGTRPLQPTARPPNTFHPHSSWDRKIPRPAGPALPPAQPVTSASPAWCPRLLAEGRAGPAHGPRLRGARPDHCSPRPKLCILGRDDHGGVPGAGHCQGLASCGGGTGHWLGGHSPPRAGAGGRLGMGKHALSHPL